TGIASLKIRYNKVFGYYIEVTKPNLSKVPPHYRRKQTTANAERFETDELKSTEQQILQAKQDRVELERSILDELVEAVRASAPRILETAHRVALCDVCAALAELAVEQNYCRPVVEESGVIEIVQGRHPVVEQLLQDERFVPNDIRLDMDSERLLLITGPNMAGKSTVIRQVALICLLAQMGSFVPAESARIGVVDRLFTRVGASDNLARGLSTFMVEMTETAYILRNATRRSLLVLDEIGRGTSTFDGLSIAWSVAEYIHDRIGARTLFATHYHEMTDLVLTKPHAANYTISVKEFRDEIIFLRTLVKGACNRSYGIQVARLAGLPGEVVERAKQVLANLEGREFDEQGVPRIARSPGKPQQRVQLNLFGAARAPSRVEKMLEEIDPDTLTPRQALELIYRMKGDQK
ncbi:MAG: DNA mismatch repair protein MutS, partial [Deltaproteobacteria bacterium]